MSDVGNSVIDYVIASFHIFQIISDFIVLNIFSFSTHTPMPVNFKEKISFLLYQKNGFMICKNLQNLNKLNSNFKMLNDNVPQITCLSSFKLQMVLIIL